MDTTPNVVLICDNGLERRYLPIPWQREMTVLHAMLSAARTFRIPFVCSGAGSKTFLTSIGHFANEGHGGRNWMYSVNGSFPETSFAVFALEAQDIVEWCYAPALVTAESAT